MQLAQYNIGRIRYPIDDPRMKDFMDNIERINSLAERVGGFVWRLSDESGNALRMGETWDIVPNITIWEDVESLHRFVFQTAHKQFIKRQAEWFLPVDGPKLVMWYVPDGYRPTMAEGAYKLRSLQQYGSHQEAFGWEILMLNKK
jgi:hypothetical protein